MENELEKLEILPKRENRAAYLTRRYGNMYETKLDHPRSWYTDESPFRLAEKLLKHYTNKPFNDLWSDWSERAKHSDLIMKNKDYIKRLVTRDPDMTFKRNKYYIDDNGILRRKTRPKPKYYYSTSPKRTTTPREWYELRSAARKEKRLIEPKEYIFKRKEESEITSKKI